MLVTNKIEEDSFQMKKVLGSLQKVGKALMTPIAVMPIAAILLRLGAGVPGIEGKFAEVILKAGAGVFDNMSILFAIGIAYGLAKNNHGAAALAGAVGYFVTTNVYGVIDSSINTGVFSGIIVGLMVGGLYNRFHNIKLPDALGFFGGKRFVPIITSIASIFLGLAFGFIWPTVQVGLDAFGNAVVDAGAVGQFFYGFGNRLLIPVGLHHVLNSIFWFTHGAWTNAAGEVINGDLFRFLAGDPAAGVFMTGFFPVMMFGLPAAAFAMYTTAKKENKKQVGGLLLSIALTSFLTGITEPLEFSFMFLAPLLYFIHAVLTGLSLVITNMFGMLHGFGFSAGLFDYVINFNLATKPVALLLVGAIYAVVYYLLFVFFITKFDLPTPGRVNEETEEIQELLASKGTTGLATEFIQALGGAGNIQNTDACITRLRMTLKNSDAINEGRLKELGAAGVIKLDSQHVQVIVGTQAESIAEAMNSQV
jgi:PTS system N-acetylglucosamine-specific IIC component